MNIDKILEVAQRRAQELGVCYKGALLPSEAYELLQAMPKAKVMDVRCRAELDWVGRIPGAIEVELLTYPGMQPNSDFWEQLSKQITDDAVLSIESVRLPNVPGTHEVCYESAIDQIEIKHTAHNREGFGLGSVLAAEWIVGKKGIFTMKDVLNF